MFLVIHWDFYLVIMLENVFCFSPLGIKLKVMSLSNIDCLKSIKNIFCYNLVCPYQEIIYFSAKTYRSET